MSFSQLADSYRETRTLFRLALCSLPLMYLSLTLLLAGRVCAAQAPRISNVMPNRGPASGGTRIRILGSGFNGATRVSFGGNPARSFEVRSDSEAFAVLPPFPNPNAISLAGYRVDAAVCTVAGCSPQYLPGNFTYLRNNGSSGSQDRPATVRIGASTLLANGQLAQGFQHTGSCPVDLEFNWGVLSTAPTTVTYNFLRNDGGHATSPGTAAIALANQSVPIRERWRLGANIPRFSHYVGWVELNIEAPNRVSRRIGFTLNCR